MSTMKDNQKIKNINFNSGSSNKNNSYNICNHKKVVTNIFLSKNNHFKGNTNMDNSIQELGKPIPMYDKTAKQTTLTPLFRKCTNQKPLYEKSYYKRFMLINRNYNHYDLLSILKNLYATHHINKYQYKDSIKRIVNKRELKNAVKGKIHFYLCNIKSSKSKSTLTALKRREQQNKRYISIDYHNLKYAVHIKKSKYKELINNKYLCPEYKNLIVKAIQGEFNDYMKEKTKQVNNKCFVGGILMREKV